MVAWVNMVTENKTWQFSKRIKNDNYNVWRKSTSQHFDLGAVISSLLKTPPLPHPLTSVNTTNVTCAPVLSVVRESEGEWSALERYVSTSKLREEHIGIWKNGAFSFKGGTPGASPDQDITDLGMPLSNHLATSQNPLVTA